MSVPARTVRDVRASRLVAELLVLQRRGRATAAELATELECSERTVYRDMQALGEAGVPVYAERGVGGGFRLVDGYRTRLTGLTADEAEALFLSALPSQAAELGRAEAATAARHKLLAALPDLQSSLAEASSRRFHLDAPRWGRPVATPAALSDLADAVWADRRVRIDYRRDGDVVSRLIEPYGLVLKQGVWYAVARVDDSYRSYRVDRVEAVDDTGVSFERDPGFELETWWDRHAAAFEASLLHRRVTVRLSPRGRRRLWGVVEYAAAREALSGLTAAEADGWTVVELPTESLEFAAAAIIALGAEAEALGPPKLRDQVAEILRTAAARYADSALAGRSA